MAGSIDKKGVHSRFPETGDKEGWTEFYQYWNPIIKRWVTSKCWMLDGFDREDIVQVVWKAVTTASRNFEGRSSIQTFIFAITRNQCYRIIQEWKSKRSSWISLGDLKKELRNSEPLPEETTENQEMRKILEELVSGLPPRQCQIIRLRFFEGLSPKEIAERLLITRITVDTSIFKALRKLKMLIDKRKI
jgi:RNA polymerase sigma-70 factor (ECF subfamily)